MGGGGERERKERRRKEEEKKKKRKKESQQQQNIHTERERERERERESTLHYTILSSSHPNIPLIAVFPPSFDTILACSGLAVPIVSNTVIA